MRKVRNSPDERVTGVQVRDLVTPTRGRLSTREELPNLQRQHPKPGHYHTNETQTFVEALVEAEHASNCERGRAVASRAPHRRTRLVPEALSIRIN